MTERVARAGHWHDRWSSSEHDQLSWFQADPQPSLDLVSAVTPAGGAVLDVGGGASLLADRLLDRGFRPTVVDLAEPSLALVGERLGARADLVDLVAGDVTALDLGRAFDTWHDRAVLHFLTEEEDRDSYLAALRRHVRPGGHAVIMTFALDGPTHCSGLEVGRHSTEDLAALLGSIGGEPVRGTRHDHITPSGAVQHFSVVVARLP